MAVELKILLWSAILGLVNIVLAAGVANRQRGLRWNIGPRDEIKPVIGVAGRLTRAFANFQETFPIFAVAVIVCGVLTKYNNNSAIGAYLYLIGRLVYLPLYALGVPLARTLAWAVSLIGIIMVIATALS